ncbi:MAG: ABC transporter permease, partial [Acidobacteriota bacterium]|nr:ABC transporter permease [Acidobacteriota bacterium]
MKFLWADFRYAWRAARRSPGVTLAIIAMLALGTGGVTAVFNPIYSQVFAPLPFPQPEQLVRIGGDIPLFNIKNNRFERREELDRIFSNLTAYAPVLGLDITLPDTGKNKQVYEVDVSEEFFETLGVLPLRGSDFRHSEERRAVVVSNSFWRNELMGADDAIGKPIRAYGLQHSIVGIMPESFDFPAGADIWTYRAGGETFERNTRQYLGRLRPEVYPGKAAEELRTLEFKPGEGLFGNAGPAIQSLRTILYGDRRPVLLMLGSSAVLFLLLVCAGVMNLLVTQGARRQSEMAIRLIHGATRRNLVFQLMRETLPLVIAGALAGAWLSELVSAWLMSQFPALHGGEVVLPVKMAFFAALVFAVTIIGGLTPALYATGFNLNTYLKSGSNSRRRFGPFSFSLREILVGVQLSLSLALLTGVVLLVNSLIFHVDVPISWSSRDMAVVQVTYPKTPITPLPKRNTTTVEEAAKYIADNASQVIEPATRQAMFFQEFQNNLRTMPEVDNVGIFNPIPFSPEAVRRNQSRGKAYRTPSPKVGERRREEAFYVEAFMNAQTSPEGFDLFGIPFIAGRPFSQMDINNTLALYLETLALGRTSPGVGKAIINQSLAKELWPGESAGNAVGKIIYDGRSNTHKVVGVVSDIHFVSNNKDLIAEVYFPADNYRRTQT